jgi:alpha-1,3-rhamnosyl/mannosyltransferase
MRVDVNLLWCLPGQVGGSEEYLARQLAGLAAAAPDIHARLFVLPGYAAAHREVAARHELVVASLDARRRSRRVLTEATWLRARTAGADVVHHGGGTVPVRSRRPIVLTVHDLQYRTYPEYFTSVKRRYLALSMPRSARRADVIAVPSEYVRRSVIDAFGVDDARVVVVPHGVDPPATSTPAEEVRERYGLGARPFVVFPAITHPHKNHRFLLDLLAGPWRDAGVTLVLTGGAGLADPDVTAAIAALGLRERVVRTGRVPADDRDGLIAAAEAVVFPSAYEGFGAPVLEAMAIGTPVVCSDRTSLPEVAGDAGLVRPLTIDAWTDALDEVAGHRAELVSAGRRRAAELTTAASGAALATAYRLAAEPR